LEPDLDLNEIKCIDIGTRRHWASGLADHSNVMLIAPDPFLDRKIRRMRQKLFFVHFGIGISYTLIQTRL